jgi:hypothetical protein
VRERASHVQHIEKVLEDANLKLSSVISDLLGKSGRAVLQAIIDGHTDPERLAACVGTRVRASRARRGAKKAIGAVAASMHTAVWHMLRDGTEWHDLGAAHFDRADAAKTASRLIRRLQQIGYEVHATPV